MLPLFSDQITTCFHVKKKARWLCRSSCVLTNMANLANDRSKLLMAVLFITGLRFFCNIRFSFIVPYMEISTQISRFGSFWSLSLLSGLICGAYVVAKYAESKGIFKAAIFISLGTLFSCFLMCFLSFENKLLPEGFILPMIRFINAFFQPAALILPTITLMKNHHGQNNIKISTLFITSALLGMQISYFTVTYFYRNNLHSWCVIFLIVSALVMSTQVLAGKLIKGNDRIFESRENSEETGFSTILFAILIGLIFSSSLRHHYFFSDTYFADILTSYEDPALGYVFFYLSLVTFLLIAANFLHQHNQVKILSFSITGIIMLAIAPIVLPIGSLVNYVLYQIAFSFLAAGFLSTSIATIYSIFIKSKRIIFNCIMWFTIGYALGEFAVNTLTEFNSLIQSNYLPLVPLLLGGFGCLVLVSFKNFNQVTD